MGSYGGESSIYATIGLRIRRYGLNSELLSSFEDEADFESENKLNAILSLDKDFNPVSFIVKELSLDIKSTLSAAHIEHYKNLYLSGAKFLQEDLVVYFVVDGYYDPGRTYGDPEHCYPPENNIEITINDCYIEISNIQDPISFPNSCFDDIYSIYSEEIEKVEFSPKDDYDDYDDRDYF